MNYGNLLGGGILAATAVLHGWVGWEDVLRPVEESTATPEVVRSTIAVAWHLLTWQFALLAAALLWCARASASSVAALAAAGFAGALSLGYAGLFLIIGWARFGDLTEMPQWTLFVASALASLWGMRQCRNG